MLPAKGVEHLVAAGNRVSANVTLSRLNVDKIEETTEIAKEMGFYGIGFSRMVPCGRGKALLDHFLTPQELKSAYQKIVSLDTPSFEVLSGDPLAGTLSGIKPSIRLQPHAFGLQRRLFRGNHYQRRFCHALQENRPGGRKSEERNLSGRSGPLRDSSGS